MGRHFEKVTRNVVLLLKDDTIADEALKEKIRAMDEKAQKMLLWSTMSAVWSYLILIVTIARIYSSFNGEHTFLLISSLVLIYLLMGVLIWFVWKGMAYKRSYFYYATKTHLKYQIDKLSGQRKLITCYLLEYGLLLLVAGIFFFLDIKHGLSSLLKLTAPVSVITYVLGLYFIANFTRQMKALQVVHRQLNQLHVSHLNQN